MDEGDRYSTYCAHQECSARFANRSGWASIAASEAGWFFQRDGKSWCPEHVPDWVPAWREQKAKENRFEACLESE